MTRYAVISKGLTVSQLVEQVKRFGGRNIRVASATGQVFCHLDDDAAARLNDVPGLTVKRIKKVSTKYTDAQQVTVPTYRGAGEALEVEPTYAAIQGILAPGWYELRDMFAPPIIGTGATVAILDSGIRKTHRGLRGKVVYEANLSDSPTVEDIFDHGTAVAYCLCGGRHAPGEDSGGAPGAKVMSIKVLDDDGEGSEENVVFGLEEIIRLVGEEFEKGLSLTDDMYINGINMSFGEPDDGDPDNPIRVACRKAIHAPEEYGGSSLPNIAAAGNAGPEPGTVMCPACDEEVCATGVLTFIPFDVWMLSSRGPTKEGLIKPDIVWYGVNINTASARDDDAFVVKSGSSFSAPYLAAGACCGWEVLVRQAGEATRMSAEDWIEWAKRIVVKPSGVPMEKDNTYGYGLPWGGEFIRQITGMSVPAMVTEMVTPVIGIAMMGMMIAGVMKGIKV